MLAFVVHLPYSSVTPLGFLITPATSRYTPERLVCLLSGAVQSRRPHDRAVALERMQQAGAFLTTAEQVTFQLLGTAESEK